MLFNFLDWELQWVFVNSVVSYLILQSLNKHFFLSKKKSDLKEPLKVWSHNFRVSWVLLNFIASVMSFRGASIHRCVRVFVLYAWTFCQVIPNARWPSVANWENVLVKKKIRNEPFIRLFFMLITIGQFLLSCIVVWFTLISEHVSQSNLYVIRTWVRKNSLNFY